MARQTPVGARPNRRRGAVLFDQDAAGRLLEGAGDRVPREMIIRSNTLRQNPAYRPGNSRSIRWGILTASTLLACYTRVPEQAIAIPPAAKPPDAPLVASVWTPRPGTLAREYLVENSARVVTTTGSGSTDDSTAIAIQASIRQVAGGGLAGLLRDIVVSSPGVARTRMPGVVLPYPFAAAGVSQGNQYSPTGLVGTGACSVGAHNALGALRDLLVRMPDTLRVGKEWADSGRFEACRAGVNLELASVRAFRVTALESGLSGVVLVVVRTATTTVRGVSVRGDDTTRITGSGSSTLRYEVDPITGTVLGADGSGSLDLAVRGRVQSESARQTQAVRISPRTQAFR